MTLLLFDVFTMYVTVCNGSALYSDLIRMETTSDHHKLSDMIGLVRNYH